MAGGNLAEPVVKRFQGERRKCPICQEWIEVGDKVEMRTFHWHGGVTLPVHISHNVSRITRKKWKELLGW